MRSNLSGLWSIHLLLQHYPLHGSVDDLARDLLALGVCQTPDRSGFGGDCVAVGHEICKGIDVRFIASFNFLGFAFTLFWIGLFDDPSRFDQIFWPMLFLGFFLGTFFAPLAVLTLHGLPSRHLLRAAEEAALFHIAAGGFGIAFETVVQFRRTPFHQLDLADHFGGRRFASIDLLQQLSTKLEASGLSADMVKSHFGALIKQQAALLALNDAFLLAGFVFLGLAAGSSHPRRVRNPRARIKGVPRRGIDGAAMTRRSQPQKWLTFGSCIGFLLLFAGCASMPNGRCFSGSHSSTDGGSKWLRSAKIPGSNLELC